MKKTIYDVIIYGGRLSGLLAAALLRDKGARVLLLNDEGHSKKVTKGYRLDFQMMPLGNIPDSPVVTNILGRIGMGLSNGDLFHPTRFLFQIVNEKHRLDIPWHAGELREEIEREFPGDLEALLALLDEGDSFREKVTDKDHERDEIFPPYDLASKLSWKVRGMGKTFHLPEESLKKKLEKAAISEDLKKMTSLALQFTSSLYAASDKLPCMPLLPRVAGYYPKGGMVGLKKLILSKLEERGVEVEKSSDIKTISVEKGKVAEITFETKNKKIRTQALIFNTVPSKLADLLPETFFNKPFRQTLNDYKPWGQWQSLFIGIDSDKIPVGMDDNLIVDDEKGSFIIQITPLDEKGAAPDGKRLVKISRPLAISATSENNEEVKAFEDYALEKLKHLIPFTDNKDLEVIHREKGKPTGTDDYLLDGNIVTPPGIGILSPLSPYKNLFLLGREIIPAFGIEGDFLAADIISHLTLDIISQREK
ncbi:MAG: hypothetical protein OEV42_17535 [Deltaproteobacteria bacterium]|nr:hypothetical protein [Deltaproteobacteria bacterium]